MRRVLLTLLVISQLLIAKDFLSYEEVDMDITGEFYTVTKGNKVEKFKISFMGIVDENSLGKMILFKVEDPNIILKGGIAEGMSGSPVYQNDKFVGAIAYGMRENPNYGLILPADYVGEGYDYKKGKYTGKSVTISPVRGDVSFDAIGTISLASDNEVYMFAHNLENMGDMAYFLNEASIEGVIPTKSLAFKVGRSGKSLGHIYSDTKYGLKGRVTEDLDFDRYDFVIRSEGQEIDKLYFEIINNRNSIGQYLEKSIEAVLNKGYKHSGYRSARYMMKIYDNEDNLVFEEENIVASNGNIKISLANTIYNRILHISESKFVSFDIARAEIEFDLYEDEKILYINSVDILGNVFLLGDKLEVNFETYVHQQGSMKVTREINIPMDFKLGPMKLELVMDSSEKEEESDSFEEYLVSLGKKTKNNEILVRFTNQYNKVVHEEKIVWDYYIISDKNFSKDIVIDSFEASN